jgi:hypothetical protein
MQAVTGGAARSIGLAARARVRAPLLADDPGPLPALLAGHPGQRAAATADDPLAGAIRQVGRLHAALGPALAPLRRLPPEAALAELRSPAFAAALQAANLGDVVARAASLATGEILAAPVQLGPVCDGAGRDWLAAHAADSTAVAVAIARELGLATARIERLAIGCLLHDLGMLALDRKCLDREGRLEPAETAALRQHPLLGCELLRQLLPSAALARQVAAQHHERQDGAGYPRGLAGTNRLPTDADRQAPTCLSQILPEAEIVAVADVFVALSARRPHRPAMRLEAAVATMRRLAGDQLNRELVRVLLGMLPRRPAGTCAVVRPFRAVRGATVPRVPTLGVWPVTRLGDAQPAAA